jgi:Cu/Ag efflux pump CusA
MFSEFNPHIFLGGDSVAFWGPLSWTMIYGLSFATILTLIVLPVLYLVAYRTKRMFSKKKTTDPHSAADEAVASISDSIS